MVANIMSYNYPETNDPPFYNWKHEKVDFIPPMPDSVKNEIKNIAVGQIHELLTNYGKVDLFWSDGKPEGFTQCRIAQVTAGCYMGKRR